MIRNALKSGFKRLLGVEVRPAAAAPPPAWRDAPAVKVEPPAPAPVVAAPVMEVAAAPPAPPVVEVPPVVETAPVVEAAPVVEPTPAPTEPEAVPAKKKGRAAKSTAGSAEAAPVAPAPVEAPVAETAPAAPAPAEALTPAGQDVVGPPAWSLAQVQEIFDEMVRPALQGDGGDITLVRIEGNDIYVRLVGSCSTCPSSIMTMKMGVEALLKEELPGFGSLIQEA